MGETDAVEGLTRLGLTTYEARVFVALQKLGSGTASNVAEVTEVPRSQVYGAADDLEERGLLEVQETRPTIYRPIPPEAAERRLLAQLESAGRDAFQYLERVRGTYGDDRGESEALWTVRGGESVTSRIAALIGEATERAVYAAEDPTAVDESVRSALSATAAGGIDAAVVSKNPEVLDRIEDDAVRTVAHPPDYLPELSTARLLLIDDGTILLSVFTPAGSDDPTEIAFWSSGTAFARALVRISAEMFAENPLETD